MAGLALGDRKSHPADQVANLARYIGIDLGTANVLVSVKGRGIVLNEPSVVAYSASDQRVVAVGTHARQMLGRTSGRIVVSRPMRDGAIADNVVTEAMLHYFIGRVVGQYSLIRPIIMVCIPAGADALETRAVLDATIRAGAGEAYVISEPLAAAIGSNLPIASASGNMVVCIGGGSCQVAVISLNDVIISRSIRVGSNKLDELITTYIRKKHNLLIGDRTAEDLKIAVGSALPLERGLELEIRGRDSSDGLPKTRTISTSDVTEAISEALTAIANNVRTVLEQTPPELVNDVANKAMVLTGGGALLRNLDRRLALETGVPAHVVDDPLGCVAIGAVRAAEYYAGPGPDASSVGAWLPKHPSAPHDYAAAVPPPPVEPDRDETENLAFPFNHERLTKAQAGWSKMFDCAGRGLTATSVGPLRWTYERP